MFDQPLEHSNSQTLPFLYPQPDRSNDGGITSPGISRTLVLLNYIHDKIFMQAQSRQQKLELEK